jgi:anti-anti-sigma factor
MQITKSEQGKWIVLTLVGKLDNTGAQQLETELTPLLTGSALALNFNEVEYVTSSGFRTLMIGLKQQSAKQGRFVLCQLSDPVRRYFEIAGLGRVFTFAENLDALVKAEG